MSSFAVDKETFLSTLSLIISSYAWWSDKKHHEEGVKHDKEYHDIEVNISKEQHKFEVKLAERLHLAEKNLSKYVSNIFFIRRLFFILGNFM